MSILSPQSPSSPPLRHAPRLNSGQVAEATDRLRGRIQLFIEKGMTWRNLFDEALLKEPKEQAQLGQMPTELFRSCVCEGLGLAEADFETLSENYRYTGSNGTSKVSFAVILENMFPTWGTTWEIIEQFRSRLLREAKDWGALDNLDVVFMDLTGAQAAANGQLLSSDMRSLSRRLQCSFFSDLELSKIFRAMQPCRGLDQAVMLCDFIGFVHDPRFHMDVLPRLASNFAQLPSSEAESLLVKSLGGANSMRAFRKGLLDAGVTNLSQDESFRVAQRFAKDSRFRGFHVSALARLVKENLAFSDSKSPEEACSDVKAPLNSQMRSQNTTESKVSSPQSIEISSSKSYEDTLHELDALPNPSMEGFVYTESKEEGTRSLMKTPLTVSSDEHSEIIDLDDIQDAKDVNPKSYFEGRVDDFVPRESSLVKEEQSFEEKLDIDEDSDTEYQMHRAYSGNPNIEAENVEAGARNSSMIDAWADSAKVFETKVGAEVSNQRPASARVRKTGDMQPRHPAQSVASVDDNEIEDNESDCPIIDEDSDDEECEIDQYATYENLTGPETTYEELNLGDSSSSDGEDRIVSPRDQSRQESMFMVHQSTMKMDQRRHHDLQNPVDSAGSPHGQLGTERVLARTEDDPWYLRDGEISRRLAPARDDILDFAIYLGMDPENDKAWLWLAEECLYAPLPPGWCQARDESSAGRGDVYYWRTDDPKQRTQWEHPLDPFFRKLYERLKADKAQRILDAKSKGRLHRGPRRQGIDRPQSAHLLNRDYNHQESAELNLLRRIARRTAHLDADMQEAAESILSDGSLAKNNDADGKRRPMSAVARRSNRVMPSGNMFGGDREEDEVADAVSAQRSAARKTKKSKRILPMGDLADYAASIQSSKQEPALQFMELPLPRPLPESVLRPVWWLHGSGEERRRLAGGDPGSFRRQLAPEDVLQMATYLGVDLPREAHLMWIAKAAALSPLPSKWRLCFDEFTDEHFFGNHETFAISRSHPLDPFWVLLLDAERIFGSKRAVRDGSGRHTEAWIPFVDEDGDTFYYDFSSCVTTYEITSDAAQVRAPAVVEAACNGREARRKRSAENREAPDPQESSKRGTTQREANSFRLSLWTELDTVDDLESPEHRASASLARLVAYPYTQMLGKLEMVKLTILLEWLASPCRTALENAKDARSKMTNTVQARRDAAEQLTKHATMRRR